MGRPRREVHSRRRGAPWGRPRGQGADRPHNEGATAAAVGPGAVRGAWGGHGLREGRGGLNVIKNDLAKCKEKTKLKKSLTNNN